MTDGEASPRRTEVLATDAAAVSEALSASPAEAQQRALNPTPSLSRCKRDRTNHVSL